MTAAVQDSVQVTLADLQLAIGAGALLVQLVLSGDYHTGPCSRLGWVSPEAPTFSRGQSALGPGGGQILSSVLGWGSVSEEVVVAAGLLPCWVPHRPQEGWL